MRVWPWIGGFFAASAATLLYGAVVEANRLVVERRRLRLPLWPSRLDGYRVALLADFHLRDAGSVALGRRAALAALEEEPDAIVMPGDFVGHWKGNSGDFLIGALEPLAGFDGPKLAVPGNHDYWSGDPDWLLPIFNELGIRLLRNETVLEDGISWVGIDSATVERAEPLVALGKLGPSPSSPLSHSSRSKKSGKGSASAAGTAEGESPRIVLWHEPDMVDELPFAAALMLSGHSHGGQFMFPWGWTPMTTKGGQKYVKGFYLDAPTPIYVSRGIGLTGPPSRLCCPPEVSILTLESEG